MSRPVLLDLFCGAGGAAQGYYEAGFDVVGVDIKPQPFYPFEFHQGDALEVLRHMARHGCATYRGYNIRSIHASPPCQFHTQMRASWRAQGVNDGYDDLLTPTLELVRSMRDVPWVAENVVGAGKVMGTTVLLHGAMFGLRVDRPRLFESNVLLMTPRMARTKEPVGVYDSRPRGTTHHRTRTSVTGKKSEMRIARTLEEAQDAMGMDWADWHGTKEAIPPAYTRFIGEQLLQHLERVA